MPNIVQSNVLLSQTLLLFVIHLYLKKTRFEYALLNFNHCVFCLQELVFLERENSEFWNELCPNGKATVTLYSILSQVKKGKNPFQMR